ncbi:MAG: restriction endonuclease subunit S [Bacteroidetes bacterium]|nr:restriction endonuclease subunit S [Bacteroidota bacterium]
MSKIDELIAELCPNGVEYKSFFDIADYVRGVTYGKDDEIKDKSSEGIPVLRANNITLGKNSLNFEEIKYINKTVKIKETQFLCKGDIFICAGSGSKEHIGKVAYINSDMKYAFGGFMAVIRMKNNDVLSRFMFHNLTSQRFREYIRFAIASSTINNLNAKVIENFKIPVPPLEVQREIVRILDNFTMLTTELTTELAKRKKQYEYYRDELLSFDEDIPKEKLGELGKFYGGLSGKSKEDFKDGNATLITYKNVYSNIALKLDIDDRVKISEGEKQNTVQYGDVLFTGSSETPDECGMSSVLTTKTDEKLYLNSFCFGYRFNDPELFLPDFTKYLFRSKNLRSQLIRTASGVTRFNVSKKKMEDVKIPVPPLKIQKRLVNVLDNFETFCSDFNIGLPAEIDARKKQYEYYRDLLLTFVETGTVSTDNRQQTTDNRQQTTDKMK